LLRFASFCAAAGVEFRDESGVVPSSLNNPNSKSEDELDFPPEPEDDDFAPGLPSSLVQDLPRTSILDLISFPSAGKENFRARAAKMKMKLLMHCGKWKRNSFNAGEYGDKRKRGGSNRR
jgi:hypothetical protein